MGTQVFDSIGDVSNSGGWTLTGGSSLNSILQSGSADSAYISCPVSSAGATTRYPLDVSLPSGAVILSVSVMVRAATGPNVGSVDPSIPIGFTVDAITSDNTSRALSRTLFPTSTIATYTLGTYTRDASGLPWDVERLNRAYLRVRCGLGVADALRIYRLYLVINYKIAPTLTVDNPTGTVTTPAPLLSWTYSQSDGDPIASSTYKVFTQAQVSLTGFSPAPSGALGALSVLPVYSGTLAGDIQSLTLPTALPPDTYWLYVQVSSVYGPSSAWVGRQFTVSCPQPGRPGDALGAGAAGVITIVEDDTRGNAELNLANTSNLQSVQSASSANIYDGVDFITTNCTFLQDTSTSFGNSEFAAWKLTPSSSADAYVTGFLLEIQPGSPFTQRVQFKAATAGKSCTVIAQFADNTLTYLAGQDVNGTVITDSTTSWTEASVTGTAPATATYVRIVAKVLSATSAAAHWVDHVGTMYGTNTPYTDGGMISRNLLSSWYATAEGTAPSGQAWTGAAGCTADTVALSQPAIGNKTHRLTYGGVSPTIALRAAGTAFTSTSSSTAYTLNKPAGTLVGDLMVAYVSSNQGGTIHVPNGWTLVNGPQASGSGGNVSLWVLKRSAGASEPSSWTDGYLGTSATQTYAIVVSYSGAADASQQFIADGSSQSPSASPLYVTNPQINNTDAGAWRLSAFAVDSPTTGGTLTSNQASPTIVPITFVGAATPWQHGNGGYSSSPPYSLPYTINRPPNLASGDLMIASVAISGGATVTVAPPTGWTLMGTTYGGAGICALAILARTAGGVEPTSWSASLTTGSRGTISSVEVVQCVAYRGADVVANQFLATGTVGAGSGTSLQGPFVNNTDSYSWIVSLYAADSSVSGSWGTDESTMRVSSSQSSTNGQSDRVPDYITTGVSDSNGAVGTGYWTVDGLFSGGQFRSACMFELVLKSAHTTVTAGANETARNTTSLGTTPSLMTGVFDSNATVAAGRTQTTGTFVPGTGTVVNSMVGWNGLVRPQTSQPQGIASMTMATLVDLSRVDPRVLELCGNQMTVVAHAAGVSNAGTPYLAANFYRANVLISSSIGTGSAFGVYPAWTKGYVTFDIPDGTTRVNLTLEVDGRPIGDVVYFKNVSVHFGADPTYRNGTAQAAHPVWAVPQVQYADDAGQGYAPWADLQGFELNPAQYDYLAGSSTYFDETLIPLVTRKYRARTLVYGLAGDQFVSSWSSETPAVVYMPSGQPWWLKDLTSGQKLALKVQFQDLALVTTGTAMSFQPLGEDYPIVVTEGYKSDTIKPTLRPVNREDWLTLGEMLRSGNTLFLQSDYDQAWWVRPLSDISYDVLASNMRQSNPIRDVTVTFLQVAPEA